MQQQLIKPQSKEHALQIIQQGFQLYQEQGHMSFSENHQQIQQSERMSFNEHDKKIKQHPKVHNIFESQRKVRNTNFEQKFVNNRLEIPALPVGRYLKFQILTNWGDKQQVGLNGIEVFDSQGGNITRYIKLAIQDDYQEKLKLIDGYQAVQDDHHIWRTKNLKPEILIDLTANIKISLIRIWNYNKSRIRSYKGVRLIRITLDDRLIFYGEIQKATGDLKKFQENCEYILFTQDQKTINRIAELDWLNKRAVDYSIQLLQQTMTLQLQRPNTGTKFNQQPSDFSEQISQSRVLRQQEQLPRFAAQSKYSNKSEKLLQQYPEFISTFDLLLEFSNGSKRFLGLSRMLLFDDKNKQIQIQDVGDTNLNEYEMQQLFYSGNLNSIEQKNMVWLKQKKIYFKFRQQTKISQIHFYNFNQSVCDSTITGPEIVKITFNGRIKIYNLRPAPCDSIDFCQAISLTLPNNNHFQGKLQINNDIWSQRYVIAYPPCGMLVTIHLISTWGDNNYIGLNGLEIYDNQGLPLLQNKLIPYSIHAVPELESDPRIVQNLTLPPFDVNCQPQRSFLAPFINTPMEKLKNKNAIIIQKARDLERQDINKIYIQFDKLSQFCALDFYNYTKDWQRGVKEVHIFVNNRLIYQGNINQTQQDLRGNVFNRTTILFSDQNLKINPYLYQFPEEEVALFNENKQLKSREYQQYFQHQLVRPKTSAQQ